MDLSTIIKPVSSRVAEALYILLRGLVFSALQAKSGTFTAQFKKFANRRRWKTTPVLWMSLASLLTAFSFLAMTRRILRSRGPKKGVDPNSEGIPIARVLHWQPAEGQDRRSLWRTRSELSMSEADMIMVFKEMASFRREGTPAAGDTVLVALPSRVEVIAHRCLLAAASPSLRRRIAIESAENGRSKNLSSEERLVLEFPDTDPKALNQMVDFIYRSRVALFTARDQAATSSLPTESVTLSRSTFQDDGGGCGGGGPLAEIEPLLDLAVVHGVYPLVRRCASVLREAGSDPSVACDALRIANRFVRPNTTAVTGSGQLLEDLEGAGVDSSRQAGQDDSGDGSGDQEEENDDLWRAVRSEALLFVAAHFSTIARCPAFLGLESLKNLAKARCSCKTGPQGRHFYTEDESSSPTEEDWEEGSAGSRIDMDEGGESFLRLPEALLAEVLIQDSLNCSESLVFAATLTWLDHQTRCKTLRGTGETPRDSALVGCEEKAFSNTSNASPCQPPVLPIMPQSSHPSRICPAESSPSSPFDSVFYPSHQQVRDFGIFDEDDVDSIENCERSCPPPSSQFGASCTHDSNPFEPETEDLLPEELSCRLLNLIRFPLMPADFLASHVEPHTLLKTPTTSIIIVEAYRMQALASSTPGGDGSSSKAGTPPVASLGTLGAHDMGDGPICTDGSTTSMVKGESLRRRPRWGTCDQSLPPDAISILMPKQDSSTETEAVGGRLVTGTSSFRGRWWPWHRDHSTGSSELPPTIISQRNFVLSDEDNSRDKSENGLAGRCESPVRLQRANESAWTPPPRSSSPQASSTQHKDLFSEEVRFDGPRRHAGSSPLVV